MSGAAGGRTAFTSFITLPLFLLYSLSAFLAAAVILLRPLPEAPAAGVRAAAGPRLLFVGTHSPLIYP
jgi:hypothetical protein